MDCKSTLTCPQKQSPFQLLISPPFSPVSAQFLFWPPLSPSTPLCLVHVLTIDSTTVLAPAMPTQYPSLPALLWSELVGGKGRGEGRETGLSCTVRLVPRTWCWVPELWEGPVPLWVAPTAAAIHFLDFRQIPWRPRGSSCSQDPTTTNSAFQNETGDSLPLTLSPVLFPLRLKPLRTLWPPYTPG